MLALILGLVIGANYTPHTILSGWDTLHPEFNFPLAFERMVSGVWRADQGLGAAAGHSHMADLPRVFLLWLTSFILPQELLRYAFFFTSLGVGVVGAYALVRFVCRERRFRELVAFMGALFYLVNLGTVQHFIVPFEMFAVGYALVPWLILTASRAIEHLTRKRLFVFILVTILASPMAYAATLWYTTMGSVMLFLILLAGRKRIKRAAVLIATILLLNIYWIAPNMYVARNHGAQIQASKINRLFTPEAFAKGQVFGTVDNTLVLKNMLFDWQIYNHDTLRTEDLLGVWKAHLARPWVSLFFFVVALLGVMGLIRTILTKNRWGLALAAPTVLSFVILLSGTWPIDRAFEYFATIAPIAGEALRFPFTKFSLVLMMGMSVLAALGVETLLVLFKKQPYMARATVVALTIWALAAFAPALGGNLIHPAMKIAYPHAYNEMFSWFSNLDRHGRVAILPIHSFWGWTYYDWGYQGAGFLQFGIPQPILDRDYDRWSPYNEQYEREMSYAVYNQDPFLLGQVLDKYDVSWVLFDSSVVAPGTPEAATLTWFIPSLLERTPGITLIKTFGSSIRVYGRTSQQTYPSVRIRTTLPDAGPVMQGAPYDGLFTLFGSYQTTGSSNSGSINDETRSWFTADERFVGPTNGPVITAITSESSNVPPLTPCSPNALQPMPGSRDIARGVIHYTSTGGSLCDHIDFPALDHTTPYIIGIKSRNIRGFPLQLCISNMLTNHCDVFEHLGKQAAFQEEWFFVPRLSDFGKAYSLNMNNFSVTGQQSENEVMTITVKQADDRVFRSLPYLRMDEILPNKASSNVSVIGQTPASVILTMPTSSLSTKESVLTFSSSFDTGWHAYDVSTCQGVNVSWICNMLPFLFGTEIKEHVLVNNWENGWRLPSNESTIILFFLPQLLQWLGFLLLPLPLLWVWYTKQ